MYKPYKPVYSPHIEIRGDSPEFSSSTEESLMETHNKDKYVDLQTKITE